MIGFVPDDIVSQLQALGPKDCPYCAVDPANPCFIHRGRESVSDQPPICVCRHGIDTYCGAWDCKQPRDDALKASKDHLVSVPADTPADRPAGLQVLENLFMASRTDPILSGWCREAISEYAALVSELERWTAWSGGQYPDESPGDVIAADADGTIILDDSLTTWNPVRAAAFLAQRLTIETQAHVTELNMATINSFAAGARSAEADLDTLIAALEQIDAMPTRLQRADKLAENPCITQNIARDALAAVRGKRP